MGNPCIDFRSSMSVLDFKNAVQSLERGLNHCANDVSLVNGEFVIHLRKPTFSEKLKMALMPPTMKKERIAMLHAVVRGVAEKCGLNGDEFLRSIAKDKSSSAVDSIHNSGIRVAVRATEHWDLFG